MDDVIHVNFKNLILVFLMLIIIQILFAMGFYALGWSNQGTATAHAGTQG